MVRYLILFTLAFLWGSDTFAQYASMQGKVLDEATGEPVPFATIFVKKGENIVSSTEADFDGNYNFSNIEAGTYDVNFSFVGYNPVLLKGVVFRTGQTLQQDLVFPQASSNTTFEELVVVDYRIPIIEQGNTTGGQTLGSEDISNLATRNINSIAATTAGVQQKDEGEDLNANGSRSSSNDTYIDGSRVIGNFGIPETEIDQVQIITSGVPAEFGDATGAIINIITKGPSAKFTGGVQLETSQFLDAFGYNRADLYFAGPLVTKIKRDANGDTIKNDDGEAQREVLLGYRVSGTFFTSKDERPSALPSFRVDDSTLAALNASPLVRDENGGLVLATNYLTEDNLQFTRIRPNARESTGIANLKLDFRPNRDFFFVVGGQFQYDFGKVAGTLNRLINFNDNSDYRRTTWRVNGRFRHTISSTTPGSTGSDAADSTRLQPVFQNFSYELQADYTSDDYYQEDPRYKDRLFEYGYIGKIYRKLTPVGGVIDTNFITNSVGDTIGQEPVRGHAAYQITFEGYEANRDINPVLSAYNDLLDFSQITTMEEMEVINGRFVGNRLSAYGLFNSPGQLGTTQNEGASYGKSNSTQIRANLRTNFDLVMNRKNSPIRHSIQLGGVYEQRIARSYSIRPFGLWTLADQSANSHLSFATDIERPTGEQFFDPLTQRFYDTYDPLIRKDEEGNLVEMTQFGERVRESLGKDQYDWINVHELDPSQLSLEMFDPSTLIQGRQRIMEYYGYDYLGNSLGANVQFNDFFTAEDANGRKTRPVAPNKPIYIAGYLQDKFTFKDMIFNLGVRFDAFDANTKVLKDPYSLAGYYNVGEFTSAGSPYLAANDLTVPSNIGEDFAVYVNDNSPDASIVGYRDGDNWYNKDGVPVNSPNELGSTIIPALRGFSTSETDPQGENYNPDDAFTDYKPGVVVMPRIAFSFPISQDANFFANYDILSQRPPDGNFASALTYFNFREIVAGGNFVGNPNLNFVGNPNLKSQRTVNYEVGFQQKLNDFSKFKLSLLYREDRNLIQIQQYVLAYPLTYTTFGNSDFATVKSFKLEYDMRNHPSFNKNLRILANYTLQFADGTGSSPTSAANTSVQELKYVFPLDFDQRHTFFLNLDYRYKAGKDYNGPKINRKSKGDTTGMAKAVNLLENMGLNLSFYLNSGSPYTRKTVPGGIGTSFPDRITEGSINGARMPWSFRMDLRLERDFVIGKNSKHPIYLNVYLRIQNLFNTRNVLSVYSVTGSPTDDGFLTMQNSPGLGLLSTFADSYNLLYDLRMNNPFNISRPRRIFLGLQVAF